MSKVLSPEQRRLLDSTVQKARTAAEAAAADALRALAVDDTHRPGFLDEGQNELRLALRAKARQLGDDVTTRGADLTLLVRDVAYEQWHRLLFARFLERNGLLRHAEYPDTPVSLDDCDELATSGEIDEPDGWSVAARFAAQLLPGVFRLDDPAVRVRLSTEHRLALEQLLMTVPAKMFETEDALGWVYQFWQTAEKRRVNDRGDKIGGADLSPVTQLFTENYMVRFLLENSLGAWWAARHPDSPLVAEWEYLRWLDDGTPAAGTFEEWPTTAAEVTVMDPCCGSGHFLVAMFGMLWRMRAEEEGLSPAEAQDAVLRDNLFGLELDPRCTQIATFNVALEAWKQGGHRELPTPQIACSGVPVRQTREEWLDGVPEHLHDAMARLYTQFRHADTLGSLIDPRPAEGLEGQLFGRDMTIGVTWDEIREHLVVKFAREGSVGSVLGHAADDIVHSARLLTSTYTLVATNPPFLSSSRQSEILRNATDRIDRFATGNLAYSMWSRWSESSEAFVIPQNWRFQVSHSDLRLRRLSSTGIRVVAALGIKAFSTSMWDFHSDLCLTTTKLSAAIAFVDGGAGTSPAEVANLLAGNTVARVSTHSQLNNPDHRISMTNLGALTLLSTRASGIQGSTSGDNPRFYRDFWEIALPNKDWEFLQGSVRETINYGGRHQVVRWEHGEGALVNSPQARIGSRAPWGSKGVSVRQMGNLPATLYTGEIFDMNTAVLLPLNASDLPALWAFVASDEYRTAVRQVDSKLNVTNATLVKVPFDHERWRKVAEEMGSLPEPHSDDPTQWLFQGNVASSTQPLQVAVARLMGYRWPDQEPDDLDRFADADGIVALPNLGEGDAASRLRELLAAAYGDLWSGALEHTLVTEAGGTTGRLEDWLRDTFFAHHCKVFDNRPFLWHVWDGRKDGFSAVLHYHRLDRPSLEKLTYTTLGAWIRRQEHELSDGTAGAEARLAAAQKLQRTLELIIEGEAPYDVFVRWKAPHEQPIGWDPDLDDGVRLNIRPFVTAGILRSRVNVHWKKDRGKNPDGTDRINDLHPTLAERRAARARDEAETA